ncbi:(2Fe-2S)-binding protein [Salinarchaeum sp. IM2453]|uniref:ferredoxin Fer n=1 Tax=Salinarchaeum sp. IM2453 TaxID=2862870 RepID=UPI001C835F44|nr:ferredoxin Fer [Salinarchaeum sp. IM2453]QZA88142.1 (2Fe-2S)-binding protein [Salinarchaeum sp. IM2453]
MSTVTYLNYEIVDEHDWEVTDEVFEKAASKDLDEEDYGSLEVTEGQYILEAAEQEGLVWPFSCRAGACANCAAILVEGEIEMDMQQILSDSEVSEENIRLTCIGSPETDEVKIIYNAKHLPYLQNRVI